MTLDSAYHSSADAPAKKPPPTADAGDHQVASPTGLSGNKIEQEGVLGAWTKDLLKEGSQAWHGFTNLFGSSSSDSSGGDKTKSKIEHVNDISSLTFDNVFGKHMGDGKGTTPADSKTVSTDNGKAHVTETNDHGVKTDVTATRGFVSGDVGDAHINHNKKTGETKYDSHDGTWHTDVTAHGESVRGTNGDTTTWNRDTNSGRVTGPDGKPILDMDRHGLTHHLTPHSTLTQTNGDAAATAAAVDADDRANGRQRQHTRIFEDSHGNTAIMRPDGLDITTNKETGDVTLQKDGHKIVVHNGKASAEVIGDDGKPHMVPLQNDQLPNGMQVHDGAVSVNGTTVVDRQGHVQADAQTTVDATHGAITTQADSGTVRTNSDGQTTTVHHDGVGDITNNGTSFHNNDPATQGVFKDWNPQAQTYDVGGPGQSGVHFDTGENGGIQVRECDGQTTSMWNNGVVNAVDSVGDFIFGIDRSGDVGFGDGSSINNDGTVYNPDGSYDGSAWSGDDSSSGGDGDTASDIADADAAADFAADVTSVDPDSAEAAAVSADPTLDASALDAQILSVDAASLAALTTEGGEVEDEISQLSGKKGAAGIVSQLQATDSEVLASQANVQAQMAHAEDSPTVSPVVAKLMASGMSQEQALSLVAAKGTNADTAEAA